MTSPSSGDPSPICFLVKTTSYKACEVSTKSPGAAGRMQALHSCQCHAYKCILAGWAAQVLWEPAVLRNEPSSCRETPHAWWGDSFMRTSGHECVLPAQKRLWAGLTLIHWVDTVEVSYLIYKTETCMTFLTWGEVTGGKKGRRRKKRRRRFLLSI